MLTVLCFPPSSSEGNPVIGSTYRDLPLSEYVPVERRYTMRHLWRDRHKFDIVAFHWAFDRLGILTGVGLIVGAKLLRKRIIWHAHEIELQCRGVAPRLYRTGMALNHLLYRCADGIVFYSEDSKRRAVAKWGRSRASHVVTVHPPTRFPILPEKRTEVRQRTGIPETAFAFGLFGAIRPYKGISELLDAYEAIRDSHTALVVAGHFDPDSPLPRKTLERMLRAWRPDIHYHLNGLADKDVPLFMAAVDAIVLPYSTSETSGVLYLALEFEKPVAAPNRGIWREVVTPECGVLYDDLAEGLNRLRLGDFRPRFPTRQYQESLTTLARLYGATH